MKVRMGDELVKVPVAQVVVGWGTLIAVGAIGYFLGKNSANHQKEAEKNS